VWLSVVLGLSGLRAADDHAVAALVEDLRHARLQCFVVGASVEGDADVTGREVLDVAGHPPWHAAGFVVQRRV